MKNKDQLLSRREVLKALAAAGGATALSTLPTEWEKPFVKVGALPAFAQVSPGQYPFTNEIESIEFSGAGSDQLRLEEYPGWLVVSETTSSAAGLVRKASSLTASEKPWLEIERKWDVEWDDVNPPWSWDITLKIKIKFSKKTGFDTKDVPKDDTDFWFFILSGANLALFSYYVTKLKIKKNKVEIEIRLPAVGTVFFPFYLSGYFPFTIVLLSGVSLSPAYYVGTGIFGDDVKSSWLK